MFKEIGQIASMMKNLPKMREQAQKLQGQIAQISAEGAAGGGMVTVKVNGNLDVVKVTLSDEAIKANDRELLEDLIAAAVNQAMDKANTAVQAETLKLAGSLGLPPGLNLPG